APVKLQLALAAVRAGHNAVQHVPRVLAEVMCFSRPRHGADEELAAHDERFHGADSGGTVAAQRAQHRKPRSVQAGHAQPGELRRAQFHTAPVRHAHRGGHTSYSPARVSTPSAAAQAACRSAGDEPGRTAGLGVRPCAVVMAAAKNAAGRASPGVRNTGGMGPQVVRYSERPELWDAITGLSNEVWPEYNQHGATLNHYWDQLYEIFPDWQFVLYDPGHETVLAEGHTIPVMWDGTDAGLGPGIDA